MGLVAWVFPGPPALSIPRERNKMSRIGESPPLEQGRARGCWSSPVDMAWACSSLRFYWPCADGSTPVRFVAWDEPPEGQHYTVEMFDEERHGYLLTPDEEATCFDIVVDGEEKMEACGPICEFIESMLSEFDLDEIYITVERIES